MLRLNILFFALLISVVSAHAQESPSQFYLLRTGYLLEGTATQNGNHYVLQTGWGSMNMPVQNVEFVGNSKKDVYLYRRNNVDPTDGRALIVLAEWCLGNGLKQEGIDEYRRASQVMTSGTLADVIQQRLETLLQDSETSPTPQMPEPQSSVPESSPISKSVFEQFVRKVQPMLTNRCASADCHGTHSQQQFKLGISPDSVGSTARRNLQSVLAYVNLDHPAESVLLSALTTTHGGMKTVLSVESEQYIQAVRWVQQVAKEMPLEQSAPKIATSEKESAEVNGSSPPLKVSVLPEQFRRAIHQTERPPVQEFNKQKESDPLDPSVFNSRYHQ